MWRLPPSCIPGIRVKAKVMKTLLCGCVTWTLGKEHFAELRTAHHRLLLRIIGFQRRQLTDHLTSYGKTLKKARCESVETTVGKRRLLFAEGVQRTNNQRLTHRVMFGTMAGGENPAPGRPEQNWAQRVLDNLRIHGKLSLCCSEYVEKVLWATAAKKGGKWYRGVVEEADCFMARW